MDLNRPKMVLNGLNMDLNWPTKTRISLKRPKKTIIELNTYTEPK